MSAATPSAVLELRDVRKSFGKTEIIRGASLAVNAGERVAIIGPNGAGKSHAVQPDQRPLRAAPGDVLLNGRKIDGLKPYEINRLGLARSFQVSNLFTRLSVFENIRCAVLWHLGYRYSFWRFLADLRRRQRPRRRGAGDDQARQAARRAGHEPDLRRAACAGDRHHDRRRPAA